MSKYSLQAPSIPQPVLRALPPAPAYARASAFLWDCIPASMVFFILCWFFLPASPLSSLTDPTHSQASVEFGNALLWDLYSWLALILRWAFVSWIAYAVWHISFEAIYSTTPGKWLVGLRVAPTTNTQAVPSQLALGWKEAALRFLCASVSWLTMNVGHAMGHWRSDKAMLHDILSQTRVVEDPEVSLPHLPSLEKATQLMFRMLAWVVLMFVFAYKLLVFITTLTSTVNSMPL